MDVAVDAMMDAMGPRNEDAAVAVKMGALDGCNDGAVATRRSMDATMGAVTGRDDGRYRWTR